jgi:hypothetical protein
MTSKASGVRHLRRADVYNPVLVFDVLIFRRDFIEDLVERPSVIFMMLSLVKHVTFLRLLVRAYSKA